MAWEDNRNKGVRDIAKEERLAWLHKQIQEMENKPQPTMEQRITPRIRRNGEWVK